MRLFKIIFILLFFVGLPEAWSKSSNKVLIVSSYGTDYMWSNSIIDALNTTLKERYPSLELNIEYLSSEQFLEPESWVRKLNILFQNYKEHPPLAVVLISDEAWMAYRAADLTHIKDTPLILCAVKPHSISIADYCKKYDTLQFSDFTSTKSLLSKYNATGVIRSMNINGYINLMLKFNPHTDGFVLATDNRFYGIYTRLLFERHAKEHFSHLSLDFIDSRFVNTDSLFTHLPKISNKKSFLLTSWLTGQHGFEFSKDYIYKKMAKVLPIPIFITNNIGIESGCFIGGYYNNATFWGKEVANMLLSNIDGQKIENIPPKFFCDTECEINWDVYNEYKNEDSVLPENVSYYNKPVSIFYKYLNTLLVIAVILFLLIYVFIYILINHIKLKKAQRLTLELMREMKKTNEQLDEARGKLLIALRKAEESDRMKSAFVANMSHEIRTPLNSIVGFSNIIATLESKEERAEAEAIIKNNSDLLLQLITDILTISEIESGEVEFSYDDINPVSICSDVVTLLRPKCNAGVDLFFDQPETDVVIRTDYSRLMQIIIIVVKNAIKFTNNGHIRIGYYVTGEGVVEFFVEDTGIGIAAERLSTIFDRFVKVNNYVEGTGLGLPIVKALIVLLGGEIRTTSELGKGTTFYFTIGKS